MDGGYAGVYPRLRGGSLLAAGATSIARGLSPPTRGIRVQPCRRDVVSRSIPAYAGDPRRNERPTKPRWVYPRLRGGSGGKAAAWLIERGLSPPTRGIQLRRRHCQPNRRSIPAYAGDPFFIRLLNRIFAVYPRLRGGSSPAALHIAHTGGLSPPTRGIRRLAMATGAIPGSIPAYAGDPIVLARPTFADRVYPRLRGGSARRPAIRLPN